MAANSADGTSAGVIERVVVELSQKECLIAIADSIGE